MLPLEQIRTLYRILGYERQYGLCGHFVNVVNNVDSTMRKHEDNFTVQLPVVFKRKVAYRTNYIQIILRCVLQEM